MTGTIIVRISPCLLTQENGGNGHDRAGQGQAGVPLLPLDGSVNKTCTTALALLTQDCSDFTLFDLEDVRQTFWDHAWVQVRYLQQYSVKEGRRG